MEHTVRPRSANNNTNPAPITSAIFAAKRLVVSHLPVIGPKFPGGPRRSLDRWQIIHIVQGYPEPMKIDVAVVYFCWFCITVCIFAIRSQRIHLALYDSRVDF